jgi:hypothetical protein
MKRFLLPILIVLITSCAAQPANAPEATQGPIILTSEMIIEATKAIPATPPIASITKIPTATKQFIFIVTSTKPFVTYATKIPGTRSTLSVATKAPGSRPTLPAATKVPTTTPPHIAGGYVCPNGSACIKGNINSDGKKIYHFPGCGSYEKTKIDTSKGERWFTSSAEAEAAGWIRAENCPH